MVIDDSKGKQLAEQTKDLCRNLRHKFEVGQKLISFALDTDQSNVSRWENPELEQYPPIYLIAACLKSGNEKLMQFGIAYMDWLEGFAGRSAQPLKAETNGKLDDELLDSAIAQGKFAEAMKRNDIDEAEKIGRLYQAIGSRMQLETRRMREERNAG